MFFKQKYINQFFQKKNVHYFSFSSCGYLFEVHRGTKRPPGARCYDFPVV